MRYNMHMRVSSVLGLNGAIHAPKPGNEHVLSEFAYLPRQNHTHEIVTPNNFKKLLVGLGAIAVAITLSRIKAPISKQPLDLINILC